MRLNKIVSALVIAGIAVASVPTAMALTPEEEIALAKAEWQARIKAADDLRIYNQAVELEKVFGIPNPYSSPGILKGQESEEPTTNTAFGSTQAPTTVVEVTEPVVEEVVETVVEEVVATNDTTNLTPEEEVALAKAEWQARTKAKEDAIKQEQEKAIIETYIEPEKVEPVVEEVVEETTVERDLAAEELQGAIETFITNPQPEPVTEPMVVPVVEQTEPIEQVTETEIAPPAIDETLEKPPVIEEEYIPLTKEEEIEIAKAEWLARKQAEQDAILAEQQASMETVYGDDTQTVATAEPVVEETVEEVVEETVEEVAVVEETVEEVAVVEETVEEVAVVEETVEEVVDASDGLTPEEEVALAKAELEAKRQAEEQAKLEQQQAEMEAVYGTKETTEETTVAEVPVIEEIKAEEIVLTAFEAEYLADSIAPGHTGNDFLRAINAKDAWDRGYTGKGSLIAILDSGINLDHPEFADRIKYTKDFTRTNINDNVGHGTAMAGIAAAAKDGVGMVGVAPDADLAIAKVTDNTNYSFTRAHKGIQWAASLDATVVNISANTKYMTPFTRSTFYQLDDGSWWNNHDKWTADYIENRRATGFYLNENPSKWANALGDSELVIVNSAGNSGLPFPENPAPMAYATKDDGSLWLNGQMIVVGAWDINTDNIASFSNKAGHICQGKNVQGGTCLDEYRMSDFYIMAPGNVQAPSKEGDLYNSGTGTSEAAAVVSGSVALIHEQWPLMTGANIVKLLTETANKDINGYDPEVHGSGLLDLEAATRPYGEVGIPIDGRYGAKAPIGGSFTLAGADIDSGALSSVMVTDEYGRDYYVDMSASAYRRPKAPFNPITKGQFFTNRNPYQSVNYYAFYDNRQALNFGNYDVKFASSTNQQLLNGELGYTEKFTPKTTMRYGVGVMNENYSFMGNSIGGAMGNVDHSWTQYVNFTGQHKLTDQLTAFGSLWLGQTQANLESQGMVTDISDTKTYSWNVGLDFTRDEHSVGATFSQPVTVYDGTINVSVPKGYRANGDIVYDRASLSMRPDANEYDLGMYYKYKKGNLNFITYGEHQVNYLNQQGETNNIIGFTLQWEF